MKHFYQTIIVMAFLLAPWACTRDIATITPILAPTPTPTITLTPISTPTPITIGVIAPSGYQYFDGSVTLSSAIGTTIAIGQSAIWDTSNSSIHPLYLDDGSTCLVAGSLAFPLTQTFSTAGTYNFHCGFHGACSGGNTTCPQSSSSCSGLASFIVVQ